MKAFLCLIAGIHDVPGNRRHGEVVFSDTGAEAMKYAIGRYGLSAVPDGSSAIAIQSPSLSSEPLPLAA